jgi:hypothetical protein
MSSHRKTVSRLAAGLLTVLLVSAMAPTADAKSFVSFNGKFHITYPDTWEQIDYRSVDFHLSQSNSNPELLRYEAVFSPTSERPFYEQPYLLLTVDTMGELIGGERDSAIASIARGFSGKIDSLISGDLFADLRPDTPKYDPQSRTLAVQTEIHEGRVTVKRNLLVIRFYEQGLANFYFYAPDSLWQKALPEFAQIAKSFAVGAPQATTPKESVKVANLEREDSTASKPRSWLPFGGAFIVIIIAIMVAVRRRRRQAATSGQGS